MTERIAHDIEMRFADESHPGVFEGYASVFGNVNSFGEVVSPGAFRDTLAARAARGFNVPMYVNHGARAGGSALPAGVWESITEDATGLAVRGRLLGLDTEQGKYIHDLAKGGALRGLSIAFRARKASYGKKPGEPRRTLHQVDLVEISLVDDPADALARLSSLRSLADGLPPERLIEDSLRAYGYSRKDSETLISALKNGGRGDPDRAAEAVARLVTRIKGITP